MTKVIFYLNSRKDVSISIRLFLRIKNFLRFYISIIRHSALGIGAASFCSEAEKDIAESPTAEPERPKRNYESQKHKTSEEF